MEDTGVLNLARSFDTVGLFTRDMMTMKRVSTVLLSGGRQGDAKEPIRRLLVGNDAFALSDADAVTALCKALGGTNKFSFLSNIVGVPPVEVPVAPEDGSICGNLSDWFGHFRIVQGSEVWENHGEWITKHRPIFGPGVKERLEIASKITANELNVAVVARTKISAHLDQLLSDGAVLVVPTSPGAAPLCNTDPKDLDDFRRRALSLTCISSLGMLPQLNLPVAVLSNGAPVGIGLIAARGNDKALIDFAVEVEKLVPLVPFGVDRHNLS